MRFEDSNAWDHLHGLPLVPFHNNPWIYTAYAHRCLPESQWSRWTPATFHYLALCLDPSGLLRRTPGGNVGSHDEIMGAAYLSSDYAGTALKYLQEKDGLHHLDESSERFNVYRFFFLVPFLKACAGYRVGIASQVLWSFYVLWQSFFRKPGEFSGVLKTWLMFPRMKQFPLCEFAYRIAETRLLKLGLTPKLIFTSFYLSEAPAFGSNAPEHWDVS